MKKRLSAVGKCFILSFIVALAIYGSSSAYLSGNFSKTVLPEFKHLLTYHIWPSPDPALASAQGMSSDDKPSSPFWPPGTIHEKHCTFLVMWEVFFFFLLFAKFSGLVDTGYVGPHKIIHLRRRGIMDWSE